MAKKAFDHKMDAAGLYFSADWRPTLEDLAGVRYGDAHTSSCPKVCLNPEHEGEQPAIDVPARKIAGLLE